MRTKWEWAGAAALMAVYLALWYVLLVSFSSVVLRIFAFWWILSSFAALLLAKFKKQNPLVSLAFSFLVGPLIIPMIMFSAPDVRAVGDTDKDQQFYETLIRRIDRFFQLNVPRDYNFRDALVVQNELRQIIAYFKLRVPTEEERIFRSEMLEIFRKIYEGFAAEYSAKFGCQFPGIQTRFADIAAQSDEYTVRVKAQYTGNMQAVLFKARVLFGLTGAVGAVMMASGVMGLYYLLFGKTDPPAFLTFIFTMLLHRHGKITWQYFRMQPAATVAISVALLVLGFIQFTIAFFPEFSNRFFKDIRFKR